MKIYSIKQPEWRTKPKTRTGLRYGHSNPYDVPASTSLLCTNLDIDLFPIWAIPGILHPDDPINYTPFESY